MKIECECGNLLRDQTDFLPYKARVTPDQESDSVWDAIHAVLQLVIQASDSPAAEKRIEELRRAASSTYSAATWRYHSLMHQCDHCGRVWINGWAFTPSDSQTPRNLLESSVRKDAAGYLIGRWWDFESSRATGIIWFQIHEKVECPVFTNWEDLQRRYHQMLDQATAEGTPMRASLRRNSDLIHRSDAHMPGTT